MRQKSSSANHSSLKLLLQVTVLVAAALAASGCASLSYYSQAAGGHLDLMLRREPIDRLIDEPGTDEQLRDRLRTVIAMRRFASEELGLPDNRSYTHYADLEREAAVYLVAAAPEFSLSPYRWCYLVVGCLGYRGYFDAADADREARRLEDEGFETRVSPAVAYSTLGWTADPVLNTMLAYPDGQLAGLLFHELAHQVVYVADDAGFSEAFATAVEQVGQERWLHRHGAPEDLDALDRQRSRARAFNALMLDARARLAAVYALDQPPADKRDGKREVLDELERRYRGLRADWDGYPGYDHWFEDGPNNADLALLATYQSDVPALRALLEQLGGDLGDFYRRVDELAALPADRRRAALDALAPPR